MKRLLGFMPFMILMIMCSCSSGTVTDDDVKGPQIETPSDVCCDLVAPVAPEFDAPVEVSGLSAYTFNKVEDVQMSDFEIQNDWEVPRLKPNLIELKTSPDMASIERIQSRENRQEHQIPIPEDNQSFCFNDSPPEPRTIAVNTFGILT